MSSVDRKLRRLENIASLRRAQRRIPSDEDLASVRTDLEEELGETVSQRLAASLLGVSHTALRRWVESGDLPLVIDRNGRRQISVSALLDLYERVRDQRARGSRTRHFLEPTIVEGRRRARQLNIEDLVSDEPAARGHRPAERRSLAYHRALAKRLNRQLVNEARYRVWKWGELGKVDPHYVGEWKRILGSSLDDIRHAIGEDSPRGRDLRQNSPFAGMLSEPERIRILESV